MKKLYSFVAVLIILPIAVATWAMFTVYNQTLPGNPATTANNLSLATTFTLPLNQLRADYTSFQMTFSSTTYQYAQTFNDGQASTATIKIATGPINGAFVYINGTQVPFSYDTGFSSASARNLCLGILNTSALSSIITCSTATITSGSPIVAATSTIDGPNWAIYTSTPAGIVINGSTQNNISTYTFSGGVTPAYSFQSSTGGVAIQLSTTSWPVGFQVLFTTGPGGAGNVPSGLSANTTYFAIPTLANLTVATTAYQIPMGPNQVALASTAANALAGKPIVITSSSTVAPGLGNVYTLTPIPYSGSATGSWQASNDGNTWAVWPSSTGVVSLSPTNGAATSVAIDPGLTDFSYVRFNLSTPPTTGALNLNIVPNAKKQNSD